MNPLRFQRTAIVWLTLLLVLMSAASICAQQQQTTPPPPGAARPLNLPKISERQLSNGLTVILAPLPNVPKVTAQLTVRVGQATAREKHPGIAQLAASVANEGTETRTSRQLKEELRSIGGTLGIFTDQDATTLFASSLAEFSPKLFELISDVIQHPAYPENEVKLAKENTIQGIRTGRADPNFLANERFQKAVFGSHPYGFVVPDEKAIAALTRENLKEFAATYYAPNNSFLVIVGDFNPETIYGQIEKAFGSWKNRPVPTEQIPQVPARDKRQIYFINRPGSIQSTIYIGNASFQRKGPDYFALRTADTIFGGSFYSRLTRNIRESKGYTYSPFSASLTKAQSGYVLAGASVRNEVTGVTLVEMFYELDRMRVAPVTDEELAAAKAYSTGNFSVELASQSGLAGRISTVYLYDLPKSFIQDFRPKIEGLTAADIQKAAAKYYDTYRAAVVIVGDYDKVKEQVMPFGDITLFDAEGNQISKK